MEWEKNRNVRGGRSTVCVGEEGCVGEWNGGVGCVAVRGNLRVVLSGGEGRGGGVSLGLGEKNRWRKTVMHRETGEFPESFVA